MMIGLASVAVSCVALIAFGVYRIQEVVSQLRRESTARMAVMFDEAARARK